MSCTLDTVWLKFLEVSLKSILVSPGLAFENLKPSDLPKTAGVYLITIRDKPYYVGRAKNLQNRIHRNHLMGNTKASSFKNALIKSGECVSLQTAKQFLRRNAAVRWIEEENMRNRGALEGYFTGILFPKYGITEEH